MIMLVILVKTKHQPKQSTQSIHWWEASLGVIILVDWVEYMHHHFTWMNMTLYQYLTEWTCQFKTIFSCEGFMRDQVVKFSPTLLQFLPPVRCGSPPGHAPGDIGSRSCHAPAAIAMRESRGSHRVRVPQNPASCRALVSVQSLL